MEEQNHTSSNNTIEKLPPKKTIFKHRWFWLIILILGGLCIFAWVYGHYESKKNSDKQGSSGQKDNPKNAKAGTDLRLVASFLPATKAAFQYNPPAIIDNDLYVGTSSKLPPEGDLAKALEELPKNSFYKLDLDLHIIWEYPLNQGSQVGGGASLDSQGNIYFVIDDFQLNTTPQAGEKVNYLTDIYLYSLTENGQFRWKQKISGDHESWIHGMINCAIDSDDTIYVGDRKLFAFDIHGAMKWQYPAENKEISGLRSSPIIDQSGNIYFVSPEPTTSRYESENIYAYKFASNGSLIWSTLLDNNLLEPEGGNDVGGGMKERWILSTPAFGLQEDTLVAAVGNTINRVSTTTGKIVWSYKPEGASGSFKASPAIDNKDNIYIGTKSNNDSKFYAIKADGSGLLWKNTSIAADMYSSPILGDDDKVYVGSEGSAEKSFHALDLETGQKIWGVGLPDSSFGSAAALYKGYVYFGIFSYSGGDNFYKIKVDANDYMKGAAWPRYHGSNANDGRKE